MRSFFIDLENVRSYGLEGILLLKPDDKVYVFYSDNANTLTIPTIESLNESSAQVKYIKTNYIGANAMDFQIVTLLGASIEKEKTGSFYIISHDNGFRSAVKFCEGYFTGYDIVTGVFANILLAINSEKNKKPEQAKQSEDAKKSNHKKSDKKSESNNKAKNNKTGKQISDNAKNDTASDTPDKIDETVNDTATDSSENGENNVKTNGHRSRRNRGRKDNNQTRKNVTESENTAKAAVQPAAEAEEEKTEVVESKDNGKNRSRNHRRKKTYDKQEEKAETAPVNTAEQKTAGPQTKNTKQKEPAKSGNYKYVYNALSDFLSKTTIDMYASKIDEGIKKSANRNELHEFFKKNYGTDEAEALYKIIYSDFEKMKKEAGK